MHKSQHTAMWPLSQLHDFTDYVQMHDPGKASEPRELRTARRLASELRVVLGGADRVPQEVLQVTNSGLSCGCLL